MLMSLDGKGLLRDDRRGSGPRVVKGPSVGEVAREAVAELVLPRPVVRMSPGAGVGEVVGVPTWLWVDRAGWRPVSRTARVRGASVTATARPVRVVWSLGDGGSVVCAGPGTPYAARFGAGAGSPDCGYVYRRSSAGCRGERFRVRAVVVWDVVWRGGGRSGAVRGLRSVAGVRVRVSEVQALVVGRTRS
jgi:hypothetical protein